tara:strand:+ start:9978 stop:10187 length:210 start_codon:yes stop_codon:yes gene_type:complete
MGSRKKAKPIEPPKLQPVTPLVDPMDVTQTALDYQQAASADDMTMQSTILTKPKRKKKTQDDSTILGSY